MRIKRKQVVASLAALAMLTAACGDSGGEDDPGTSSEAPADDDMDSESDSGDEGDDNASGEIATDIGVDEETIRVGLLSDLDGPFAGLVQEISAAQQVFFDQVNENGGIGGRMVEVVEENTSYDVPTHLEKYDLLRDEVAIISLSTGSPHTAAISESLVQDDLIALPLSWFSGWAEDSTLGSNVFELYANYCLESMNGIEYHVQNNGVETIAIIGFPGEYGGDGSAGAAIAAEELGLEVVYDGSGQVTPPSADNPNPDQSAVISQIVDSNADMVWMTGNPATLGAVMGGAVSQGYEGIWSGNSPTYSYKLLGTELAPVLDAAYFPTTYVAPFGSDVPGMPDLVEAMTAAQPELPSSDSYILGWTYASLTAQILQQAADNGDMTRAGILAAAGEVEATFDGLAPDQSYAGDPNDFIVRSVYIYDIEADEYDTTPLGEGEGGTGSVLLEGEYAGDVASNYEFTGACFTG